MNPKARHDLHSGERQVAPTVAGIRRDHVARYEWADSALRRAITVLDFACGVGYGTQILADRRMVYGMDIDAEAIDFARENFPAHSASYEIAEAECAPTRSFDAVVCFETIEHIADPGRMLRAFRAPLLLASVPNEERYPFTGQKFHFRHYTRAQFEALLRENGWKVREWWGQDDTESSVKQGLDNPWTLIAVCDAVPVDDGMLSMGLA